MPDVSSTLIDVEVSIIPPTVETLSLVAAEWPSALPAPLLNRGHTIVPGMSQTIMETGRIRQRPLFVDVVELMDVQWHLTEDQFEIFEQFVEVDLNRGTLRTTLFGFDSSSIQGVNRMVWRVVAFYPGGEYSFSHTDNLFTVKAAMEVIGQFYVEGSTGPDSEIIGDGSPEGVVDAPPGTIYWDRIGKFQWVKEKGVCAVGWREQYGGGIGV